MSSSIPIAKAVPIADAEAIPIADAVAEAIPIAEAVSEVNELSEKEWLQKFRPGKYKFKEEDMKDFPYHVVNYVKSWPNIEGTYTFYVPLLPMDEANTAAAAVLCYQGSDAAVNYMMKMAGSYSQMRSMYG
jgi:hypothetical protein